MQILNSMVTASLMAEKDKGSAAWLGSSRWLVHGCQSRGGGPCCAKLLPVLQLRWVSMCLSTCFHLFSQIGLRLPQCMWLCGVLALPIDT